MKRQLKIPDLILTSDWHLRSTQPVCRTDNFWDAQWGPVCQVSDLQEKYNCPVLHAGDLFHYWNPSAWLLSYAIANLPKKFYTIFGQHDLPEHNLDLEYKSGINTLRQAGTVNVLKATHWGQKPKVSMKFNGKKICVYHHFVWDGKKVPWPGCDATTSKDLLKKYPKFDLILTGDHHKPFVTYYKDRVLVNPGCLTRQHANYADHKPRVYLWYSKTNTVEAVYLKVPSGVVVRDHLEKGEQRNERIDAFLSRVKEDWEIGTSFEKNIDHFLNKNKVKKNITKLVYKAIEV